MAHRIRRSGDGWLGCTAVQHSRTELGAGNAPMIKHFAQDLSGPAGCISFYACYDHILMISDGEHWCCGQWRSKPPKQQGSVPRRFDLAVVRCRTQSQRDKWLWRCEENNGSGWQMEKVFASFVPHSSHDIDYNFTYIHIAYHIPYHIPYTIYHTIHTMPYIPCHIYHIPYTIHHIPYIAKFTLPYTIYCQVYMHIAWQSAKSKKHTHQWPQTARLMNSVNFGFFSSSTRCWGWNRLPFCISGGGNSVVANGIFLPKKKSLPPPEN